MSRDFMITLYTHQSLANALVMQRLWTHLDTPLVQPRRYDLKERTRYTFSPEAYSHATTLYKKRGFLLIRGGEDQFLATFSKERNWLSVWRIQLEAGAAKGERRDLWRQWLFELCEALPVLYGYACSTAEHETKHALLIDLPNGLKLKKPCGDSVREFFRYLPGIYWLTLFGKQLGQTFATRWSSLEGRAEVKFLAGEQVAVQLPGRVFPYAKGKVARLQHARDVADALGAQYFFDQTRMEEMEFQAAPELSAAIGPWYVQMTPKSAAQYLQIRELPPVSDAQSASQFLHRAYKGDLRAVAAYLTLGMPVNTRDPDDQGTALIRAAQGNQQELLHFLVESGADLEARDTDDDTALMNAINWGNYAAMRTLIDLGADVNAASRKHGPPLIRALLKKRNAHIAKKGDFVMTLLRSGADARVTFGEEGYTPLYYTLLSKQRWYAAWLINAGDDINARTAPHNRPLLTSAILKKQWGIAKSLIAAGADLNAVDDLGWTPWQVANYVGWGPWRGRQLMFWDSWNMPEEEKKPDDWKGEVLMAGTLGWMNWRKHLASAQVTMEFPPAYHLLVAARAGDVEGLQAALGQGADVNAPDPHGHTALALARQQDSAESQRCVALLLAAGADPGLELDTD